LVAVLTSLWACAAGRAAIISVGSMPTRTLRVQTVDILQVSAIDDVSQRFSAQILAQFRIDGGALDAALTAGGKGFPMGADGKPTFLPPAGWYLAQFDATNVVPGTFEVLEERVLTIGDDLVLNLRFNGVFFEYMELQRFPFDVQDLQVTLACNCRTTGRVSVDLVVAKDAISAVVPAGFQLFHLWDLVSTSSEDARSGAVTLTPTLWGPRPDRKFPAVIIGTRVKRRHSYYVVNIMVPMVMFVLLSMLQWVVPRYDAPSRLSITLTLVLTAAAYKFAVSTMMPAISYLTILDKYVIFCWLTIMAAAFEGGLLAVPPENSEAADVVDRALLGVTLATFVVGNAYFARHLHRSPAASRFKSGHEYKQLRDSPESLSA